MTTIPTPQELAADLAPIVQGHIDLLAAKLRAAKPHGGRRIIDRHGVPYEHQDAVAAEFRKAGWTVKWHDSQIDGTSVEFTAAGIASQPGYGAQGDAYRRRVEVFITASPLVYEAARDMRSWLGTTDGMAAALQLVGIDPLTGD